MRTLVLQFIAAAFIMLTVSRCALAAWQADRVHQSGRGLWPIIRGGLRIDAVMIAMLAGIPALLSPWVGHFALATEITQWWFLCSWLLLVLLEVSTPQFIFEYDSRPNRLYVEYLKHPSEVFGMLWKGYKFVILAGVLILLALEWLAYHTFSDTPPDSSMAFWLRPIVTLVVAAGVFLAIRGTIGHRPINPSSVAYCGDSMLNTLPLNSLYNVLYAIYSMKNERSAADVYGKMPASEMHGIVNRRAGLQPSPDQSLPSLHRQDPIQSQGRPLNIVLIVEESLGAQYVGHLGGASLTPCLDQLATENWRFTRAYATGTRSVRGLEAIVAGFPPTLSDAALRLSGAQQNFFTLAQLLKKQGYRSHFIYGGEAHFDNMKSFFMGNGFDELHERNSFNQPKFVGTWGASDEDMFDKLDQVLSAASQPTLALAFSVSNHSPWEYPEGRIEPQGDPASVQNTVRYADWALGQFFDKAKKSAYWNDTVFLVVADHDSRVFGANLLPLRHFHIPAVIAGGQVAARGDDRLISQIDLPPTLLSLAGLQTEHPMIGQDLTRDAAAQRAMMQYGENYGYLQDDRLLVLEPHRPATQYRYRAPEHYEPMAVDPELALEARAHVLWPHWMYMNRCYTLPHLHKANLSPTST